MKKPFLQLSIANKVFLLVRGVRVNLTNLVKKRESKAHHKIGLEYSIKVKTVLL